MRIVASLLVAVMLFPAAAAGQESGVSDDELERRISRANWMIEIGRFGCAGLGALTLAGTLAGESHYDKTWMLVGNIAGIGATVTGFVGRRMKSNAIREREKRESRRQHVVSVAPLPGAGVAGVYAVMW